MKRSAFLRAQGTSNVGFATFLSAGSGAPTGPFLEILEVANCIRGGTATPQNKSKAPLFHRRVRRRRTTRNPYGKKGLKLTSEFLSDGTGRKGFPNEGQTLFFPSGQQATFSPIYTTFRWSPWYKLPIVVLSKEIVLLFPLKIKVFSTHPTGHDKTPPQPVVENPSA
jgi:hypothetical protein